MPPGQDALPSRSFERHQPPVPVAKSRVGLYDTRKSFAHTLLVYVCELG